MSADAARCPVTGMSAADGACPASGSTAPTRTFHLEGSASFAIDKTSSGRVLAARLLGQPTLELFISETATKRAVERLTADWDLPPGEVIIGDEWMPELFLLALFRFGYLGPVAIQASKIELDVCEWLDVSGDMLFYLKSVWRGVKGSVCVPSTAVLSRVGADGSIPEPTLRRQPTTEGDLIPPVIVSSKGQKTLILTGASRGIGHATVKLFVMQGFRVITISRHPFDEHCPWPGGAKNHFVWDLADLTDADSKISQLKTLVGTGKIEALVLNAGISPKLPGGARMGVAATDLETWHRVLNVNLVSSSLLVRGLKDELVAGKASIVMVSSIAGSRVHPFAGVAYACSKAGLFALTREIAKEFAPLGVRCNAISPGEIETSILSPGTDDLVAHEVPMKRLGQPSEVAETIFWLCSEKSSYGGSKTPGAIPFLANSGSAVTGSEVHINGGQHV